MSHTRSAYEIEQDRLRRRRAVQAALAEGAKLSGRLEVLRRRLAVAQQEVDGLAVPVPLAMAAPPAGDEAVEAVEGWLRDFRGQVGAAERDLDAALAQARVVRMLDQLSADGAGAPVEKVHLERRASAAATEDRSRVEAVARILERLEGDVEPDTRADVEKLAAQVTVAASSTAAGLELELRQAVNAANAAALDRRAMADEASMLRAELRGFEGVLEDSAVEQLDAMLVAVEAGDEKMSAALRRQVEAVRARAAEESERRYVADVVTASLDELGYTTADEFEETLSRTGQAYFQRDEWADYAVRVRLDADADRLDFDVVRMDDGPELGEGADTAAEERWCGEVPAIEEALGRRGVALDSDQRPPGPAVRAVARERTRLRRRAPRSPVKRSEQRRRTR